MRQTLTIHPDFQCAAVSAIAVEVLRAAGGRLDLRYTVSGDIGALRLPPPAAPVRTDELWKHTCFEIFVRPVPGTAYREFNFAPSTQWAAYSFDAYREGMRAAEEIAAPRLDVRSGDTLFELRGSLVLPDAAAWLIGLSAVIEETNGAKSYWALKHPQGRADFHHDDCFALELSSA